MTGTFYLTTKSQTLTAVSPCMWIIALSFLLSTPISYAAIDLEECGEAIGMESGDIKDEEINASSSHSIVSVGPQSARLNKEINSGAWCPNRQISKDVIEYLEISLNSIHVVTGVATQGRFGNGQGLEFAEEYMLEYWRPGLLKWLRYKNALGQEIFKGNTNTYTVEQRKLNPIVIASKMRFIPFSVHLQTVCMRVEVYGCPWNGARNNMYIIRRKTIDCLGSLWSFLLYDGLVSYSMPQGERRGAEIDLSDKSYDGTKDDTYLEGGLGQLTDGVVGDDNFKTDKSGMGRGYEWIGWKNDSSFVHPIELNFEFDQVREFITAYFYCNNMYTKDVQVFSTAKFWFSIGGKYFNGPPVDYSYMPDIFFEEARNVSVPLHHKLGKYVKVEITFASKWILLSEVSFNTVPATGNFTEENPPVAPPIVSTAMSKDEDITNQYVGLVIGVLAAVILILIIFIIVIIIRNKKRKHNLPHTTLKPSTNRVTINMKDLSLSYSQGSSLTCQSNGNIYGHNVILDETNSDKQLYQEPQDCKIPYHGPYNNESPLSSEYAVPDITNGSCSNPFVPLQSSTSNSISKPAFPQTFPKALQNPPSEQYYAATDVIKMSSLISSTGNGSCESSNRDLLNKKENSLQDVPRLGMLYKEKLVEGQLGEAFRSDFHGYPNGVPNKGSGNSESSTQGSGGNGGQELSQQNRRFQHDPRPVLGSLLHSRRACHTTNAVDNFGEHTFGKSLHEV